MSAKVMSNLCVAAFVAVWGAAAGAKPVEPILVDLSLPLITFTGLTSQSDPYVEDNFSFTPTSYMSGNCAPGPTANDPCIKEVQQSGVVTTMTSTVLNGLFSLTSFFFDLQGTGSKLIVSSDKTDSTTQLVFEIGQLAPGGAQLYDNYAWAAGNTKTVGSIYNGLIGNNDSYLALITSSLFTDVKYVTWSTEHAQNLRIDDIGATVPSVVPVGAVPLPAAGWLMIAGLGGLAALRRKRKAA